MTSALTSRAAASSSPIPSLLRSCQATGPGSGPELEIETKTKTETETGTGTGFGWSVALASATASSLCPSVNSCRPTRRSSSRASDGGRSSSVERC